MSNSVYLAGPGGFTLPGRLWHDNVVMPAIEAVGLVPLDPWSANHVDLDEALALPWGEERRQALAKADFTVGRANKELIDISVGMLALLDGTDVDSGTAAEIGYGYAKGVVIVGLRTDFRLSSDNEGTSVNLQVEYFIRDSGGIVTDNLEDALRYLAQAIGS